MDHDEWRTQQTTVPIGVDRHEFDLAVAEFGTGAPATLFLHGIPTWGYLFREVYGAADHAIIPDLPGYGYTEHVGPGGYNRSVRVMEEAAVALLDAMGLTSVNVVGHDLGGSAALRLAVHTDRVDRLVLSNVGCYDSWPVEFIHNQGLPSNARDWTRDDIEEKLDFVFGSGTYRDDNATFVAGMKAPFLDPDHDVTRLARNAVSTNTNHTLEISEQLDEIDAPTLLLWGGEDILQSTDWADRLAEDIPMAEREYLDQAYHWVMQDRPTRYRDALAEFLGSGGGGG